MANDYFKFKQFIVYQGNTAMKVGVDGVLLGSWANPAKALRILDIGTGTGLLSLMMAQKSLAEITALEIDAGAYTQAVENIKNSKWAQRVSIQLVSFQDFVKINTGTFDFLICNPPYFSGSLKSKSTKRNMARHETSLSLEQLVEGVHAVMSPRGRFTMVYPFSRKDELLTSFALFRIYPSRLLEVKGSEQNQPNRLFVEFSRENIKCTLETLTVRDDTNRDYTEDYKNLTKDFYLAF